MNTVYTITYWNTAEYAEDFIGVWGKFDDAVLHAETQVEYMLDEYQDDFPGMMAASRKVIYGAQDVLADTRQADVMVVDGEGRQIEGFRVQWKEVQ